MLFTIILFLNELVLKINFSISGSNIEIDENFVKKVNKILELKKPVELSLPIQKFKEKVIVINFKSDLNADNISSSTSNATLETQPCLIKENLNLNLEESFFLNFALGCLKILDKNNLELSTNEVWQKFISAQANFLDRYIIYHYYRTKGWIVRSGLKYGGDFLLYKDGPTYNHASYLVKILNEKTELSWKEFLAINRLVETFNKVIFFNIFITWLFVYFH